MNTFGVNFRCCKIDKQWFQKKFGMEEKKFKKKK